ncbi:MAG: hypothetical protein CM15mP119_3540 [Alphaproteobacteria bacterium]|nr:MAG: hypothetical protein CM15mP119_3540 [Alphaproteobacteria bacterium]
MTLYDAYVVEIAARAKQGLQPKPIDDGALTAELITQLQIRAVHIQKIVCTI